MSRRPAITGRRVCQNTGSGLFVETSLPHSTLRAIVTDAHFWIPVVVLILGTSLLLVLR